MRLSFGSLLLLSFFSCGKNTENSSNLQVSKAKWSAGCRVTAGEAIGYIFISGGSLNGMASGVHHLEFYDASSHRLGSTNTGVAKSFSGSGIKDIVSLSAPKGTELCTFSPASITIYN